jgi:hypothetical protein
MSRTLRQDHRRHAGQGVVPHRLGCVSSDPGSVEGQDTVALACSTARSLRVYRDWIIDEVTSGSMSMADLLEEADSDERLGTVKVVVLAQVVPGVGKVRSRRAMARLGIAEDARWGELEHSRLVSLWKLISEVPS